MILAPVFLIFATAAATPASPETTDPLERVKCVREQVTGSLVSSRKVCHTEKEWRRIRNDAESETRRLMQPGTGNDKNG